MKRKLFFAAFVSTLILMFACTVFADADNIESRIKGQQKLINDAINSGSLTKREIDVVQDNLNRVKDDLARIRTGRKVTDHEYDLLSNLLDQNERMITDKSNPVKPVRRPDVQRRFEDQQRRIDQGLRSGTLTRKEVEIVSDNLNRIKEKFVNRTRDGKLTDSEEELLQDLLDRNSEMIQGKKNNPISSIKID